MQPSRHIIWNTGLVNAQDRKRLCRHFLGLDQAARVCRFNVHMTDASLIRWSETCRLDCLGVVCVENAPVAVLEGVRAKDFSVSRLWEVGVSVWQGHRERGHARALLEGFLSSIPDQDRVLVHTRPDNTPMLSLSRSVMLEHPDRFESVVL